MDAFGRTNVGETIGDMQTEIIRSALSFDTLQHRVEYLESVEVSLNAYIDRLKHAARTVFDRHAMTSGQLEMAECDAICKEVGLEPWKWPKRESSYVKGLRKERDELLGQVSDLEARVSELEGAGEPVAEAYADYEDWWGNIRPDFPRVKVRLLKYVSSGTSLFLHPAPDVVRDGWQPIETAPKDGTHILAAQFNDGVGFGYCGEPPRQQARRTVVHWFEGPPHPAFYVSVYGGDEMYPLKYTHWMPLPPPPQPDATKEAT